MLRPPSDGVATAGRTLLREGWVRWHAFDPSTVTQMTEEYDRLRWWRKDELDRGTGRRRPFIINPKGTLERRIFAANRIPTSLLVASAVGDLAHSIGETTGSSDLREWSPNRLVVNKMPPRGEIFSHRDVPRYVGILAIVSCQPAEFTCAGKDIDLEAGDFTIVLAQDVAQKEGVDQPEHAVVNLDQRRYSLVVTQDINPAIVPARFQRGAA